MMRFSLLVLILLCGCVNAADRAQTGLIGMSRGDLMSCAGVPDKREELPDREILQYQQDKEVEGPLTVKGPFDLALSVGAKGTCHAVLTLRDGVVSRVGYTGPSGTLLGPYAACAPILKGCVKTETAVRKKPEV